MVLGISAEVCWHYWYALSQCYSCHWLARQEQAAIFADPGCPEPGASLDDVICPWGYDPALHHFSASSNTPCPHSGPLTGESYPRILLLQSRWSGIGKQRIKGPVQCGESFHGESVITSGSPEITGLCKAAPQRWEANVTYQVLEHDRCAELHCSE